ncbi:MAG: hypothetical protein P3W95_003215 [Tepidimonas taiwanensis]|nr:hypothetical protein [Tepidimonas taiwanensis]
MEGDVLGGLMRWQVGLWLIGAAIGAVVLVARAFAQRVMRGLDDWMDRVGKDIRRVDDELARLRAELPLHYIRREDHIRDMAAITTRLDRIHEMLFLLIKEGRRYGE